MAVREDGSKAPLGASWKRYQIAQPTEAEMTDMFGAEGSDGRPAGFGLALGMGEFECLETEDAATEERFVAACEAAGLTELLARITAGYADRGPGGGVHRVYQVENPDPNTKLAMRREFSPDEAKKRAAAGKDDPEEQTNHTQVLVETRGAGGFIVCAPSGGPVHKGKGARFATRADHEAGKVLVGKVAPRRAWKDLSGGPETVVRVSPAEKAALWAAARTLDELPTREEAPAYVGVAQTVRASGAKTVGDWFDANVSWREVMAGVLGWKCVKTVKASTGVEEWWMRPGDSTKERSAVSNHLNNKRLTIFSSSVDWAGEPAPGQNYPAHDKLGVIARAEHDGDFSAAVRWVRENYDVPEGIGVSDIELGGMFAGNAARPSFGDWRDRLLPHELDIMEIGKEFWEARPVLTEVRDFAYARRVSPWALLGNALCMVLTAVPPSYVLPGTVGSEAGLNFFMAAVAKSGGGKDTSAGAAEDYVQLEKELKQVTPGSGEGINKQFAVKFKPKGKPYVQVNQANSVMFVCSEVDTLNALKNRDSSTLGSELRKAWSGDRLGFAYATEDKAVTIQKHRYRMTMTVNVQPGRAGAILGEAAGGTPQRFLWMPATDPVRTQCQMPTAPEPRLFRVPREDWDSDHGWAAAAMRGGAKSKKDSGSGSDGAEDNIKSENAEAAEAEAEADGSASMDLGLNPAELKSEFLALEVPVNKADLRIIAIPEEAAELIQREIDAKEFADYEGDELDSHAQLMQLKVAAALMFMDNRHDKINDADWELAGMLMKVSSMTRSYVLNTLAETEHKSNIARGKAEATRTLARDDVITDTKTKAIATAARRIRSALVKARTLHAAGGQESDTMKRTELRRSVHKDHRKDGIFDAAMEECVADGVIESLTEDPRSFRVTAAGVAAHEEARAA
ncbi:hypothetical protein [Actinomycetospora sp. CA-053990]|uniref:hypothetical protein n=1 Tax=Actinomycetospora sp. CA-053990 TaxID=3239891 RepID=UPI003D8CD256